MGWAGKSLTLLVVWLEKKNIVLLSIYKGWGSLDGVGSNGDVRPSYAWPCA